MKKLISYLENILKAASLICFATMVIVVLIQIYGRMFLPKAASWTEELSRMLFISAIGFASPIALKQKAFVRVDTILEKLNEKTRAIFEIIINIGISVFMFIVAYNAMLFSKIGSIQKSPSLGIVMAIPFSAILVATLFMGIFGLIDIKYYVDKLKGKPVEDREVKLQ